MQNNLSQRVLKTISGNFLAEIKKSYKGDKTSLHFVIHELPSHPIVVNGEIFQSLVVGGTIVKTATLKKNGEKILILDQKEKYLPFKTEKGFLEFADSILQNNVNILALNFAYPIRPLLADEKLDGVLLTVTKEGQFHGLIGKEIGKEIENYVFSKRNRKIKVTVANDTVCLLTSGLSQFKKENLAGGIVGTGLNFAFFLDENKLVNLEAANFDKFPQTKEGKIIDDESNQPGKALFEKETSGAYLYKHFNIIIRKRKIIYPNLSSTEELDIVSHKNIPRISKIARDILKRSAQLVACQIAGIVAFKERDMIFNMEGSLFWKGNNYKKTVEETVRKIAPKYKIDFVEIENSAILGAAKLAG